MILTHARQFSEAVAGAKINEVLLVVPAFTTQNERVALSDAIELTGMKVLCRSIAAAMLCCNPSLDCASVQGFRTAFTLSTSSAGTRHGRRKLCSWCTVRHRQRAQYDLQRVGVQHGCLINSGVCSLPRHVQREAGTSLWVWLWCP